MDIMASPWRSANDSPSRQLLWELGQLTSSREAFNAQLDRENDDRAILHRQALEAASAQHDRVRRTAEQYRERLEQQIQAERRRREEETQKEIDKLCREKEEEEQAAKRREIERARTAEAEKKRAAEIRRREKSAADERKANEEQQDAEIARRLEVEKRKESLQREQVKAAEAKAAEANSKEAASAAQLPLSVPTTKSSPPPAQLSQPSHRVEHQNPALEAEHQKYLEIHQRLKGLRKAMASQAKQNPTLKTVMGDMRREIKKCVGQLRQGKGTNRSQVYWARSLTLLYPYLGRRILTFSDSCKRS